MGNILGTLWPISYQRVAYPKSLIFDGALEETSNRTSPNQLIWEYGIDY